MTALKDFFSLDLVVRLASSLAAVSSGFPERAFVADASRGLEHLELLDRARHITRAMHAHLPASYPEALAVVLRSLGPEHHKGELLGAGMAPFFYLPHTLFVAEYGLGHFALSMRAQHELTRRFSCEFSVRRFLEERPDETLAVFAEWVDDPSPHVRRLVSEGTRPRLPWAPRVRWLGEQPERVLPLLEALRDDPASLVRRSVANHLNDLAKSDPERVVSLARRWLRGASAERRALVEHALRSLVKRGHAGALDALGFGARARVVVEGSFAPRRVRVGGAVRVKVTVHAERSARAPQSLVVDLVVHFVKARGATSPKVFKLKRLELAAGASAELAKTVSLAVHTTRTPYPGTHPVQALVNGVAFDLGAFEVTQ